MKTENYMKLLDDIRKSGIESRSGSDESISSMAISICNELNAYELFIPEFFSNNGSAKHIRNIYKTLSDDHDYCAETVINCVDMDIADKLYQEYHEGMYDFIKEMINASRMFNKSTDLNLYEENIKKANSKDSLFIKSIFGGELNKADNVTLTEAVKNIESLIDFMPQIHEMKVRCEAISKNAKDISDSENPLVKEGIKLLYESVSHYCCESIKNTVNIYSNISDKIFNKDNTVKEKKFVLL